MFDDPRALVGRAQAYIETCAAASTGPKGHGRFPNLAGFCRYLGVGVDVFEEEMAAFPEESGVIRAMLEDEALNSEMAATLVSAYLKTRLGYGEAQPQKHAADSGEIKLVFEHDIYEDGG